LEDAYLPLKEGLKIKLSQGRDSSSNDQKWESLIWWRP